MSYLLSFARLTRMKFQNIVNCNNDQGHKAQSPFTPFHGNLYETVCWIKNCQTWFVTLWGPPTRYTIYVHNYLLVRAIWLGKISVWTLTIFIKVIHFRCQNNRRTLQRHQTEKWAIARLHHFSDLSSNSSRDIKMTVHFALWWNSADRFLWSAFDFLCSANRISVK